MAKKNYLEDSYNSSLSENERLIKENIDQGHYIIELEEKQRRYYLADGTFMLMNTEDEVIEMRQQAAKIIPSLNRGIGECRDRYEKAEEKHYKASTHIQRLTIENEQLKTERESWGVTCNRETEGRMKAEEECDRLCVLLKDCYDMKIFGHGLSDLHESSPLVKRIEEALKCKHDKGHTDYCEPCGRIHGG